MSPEGTSSTITLHHSLCGDISSHGLMNLVIVSAVTNVSLVSSVDWRSIFIITFIAFFSLTIKFFFFFFGMDAKLLMSMMNKLQLLHALYMLFNYALHSNVHYRHRPLRLKNRITDEMTFVLVVFVTWNVELNKPQAGYVYVHPCILHHDVNSPLRSAWHTSWWRRWQSNWYPLPFRLHSSLLKPNPFNANIILSATQR